MCNEKNDCCCNSEQMNERKSGCNKSVPHKSKGTKEEYPCGQKRDGDDNCCCEEGDEEK